MIVHTFQTVAVRQVEQIVLGVPVDVEFVLVWRGFLVVLGLGGEPLAAAEIVAVLAPGLFFQPVESTSAALGRVEQFLALGAGFGSVTMDTLEEFGA